ncbi:MAG: hypothetical protein RLZZ524_2895, partial [Pseudomonadota bacterium]
AFVGLSGWLGRELAGDVLVAKVMAGDVLSGDVLEPGHA